MRISLFILMLFSYQTTFAQKDPFETFLEGHAKKYKLTDFKIDSKADNPYIAGQTNQSSSYYVHTFDNVKNTKDFTKCLRSTSKNNDSSAIFSKTEYDCVTVTRELCNELNPNNNNKSPSLGSLREELKNSQCENLLVRINNKIKDFEKSENGKSYKKTVEKNYKKIKGLSVVNFVDNYNDPLISQRASVGDALSLFEHIGQAKELCDSLLLTKKGEPVRSGGTEGPEMPDKPEKGGK